MPPSKSSQRLALLGLFAVFFLPIAFAYYLNVVHPAWQPFGTRNHGELLSPSRELPISRMQVKDPSRLEGKWTFIYAPVSGSSCDGRCITVLQDLNRLQAALGRDGDRVQSLLLLNPGTPAPGPELPVPELPVIVAFGVPSTVLPEPSDHIYLVDPQGYLVLRYSPDVPLKGMVKDLERLLKISKIG